jgi:hypothetical protein
MRWQKVGFIFKPSGAMPWMAEYAAVPIAQHLEGDLFKIYFSARDRNNRSSTGDIVIDLNNPCDILSVGEEPMISPGVPGAFDDSGAMATCMVAVGTELYLYYIGWNLGVTVPFRNSIGLAISRDSGTTFQKFSEGPIIDRSIIDPCFVASNCVVLDGAIFRMWYLSCFKWAIVDGLPKHYYHIKYAESTDGVNWQRNGLVAIDFKDDTEYAISVPRVIKEAGVYKMWYSCRGASYRIGYAESQDGIKWVRKDEEAGIDVSATGWDSKMVCYPFIFDHKGQRYMLYNGNGYGKTGFGLAVLG